MSVVNSYTDYFATVKEYNAAPDWQKALLLRGTLLTKCHDAEPVTVRHRLRRFWEKEAIKRGVKREELQTWG
jgi:hypothetical protein